MAENPGHSEIFSPVPPPEFSNACTQVARFVDEFNAGTGFENPQAVKFLSQFVNSPAMVNLYVDTDTWDTMDTDPQLPAWLRRQPLMDRGILTSDHVSPDQVHHLRALYQQWGQEQGYPLHALFFTISPKNHTVPTHEFKMYVAEKPLLKALEQKQLPDIFRDLQAADFLPFEVKLYNDFLVLYYSKDIRQAQLAEDIFGKHQVPFRGPAEDVFILRAHGEEIVVEEFDSNDQTLNRFHFRGAYSDKMFISNYIENCYRYGKNPAKPYETSFVWLETPDTDDPQQLITRAQEIVQRPVLLKKSQKKEFNVPPLPTWLKK